MSCFGLEFLVQFGIAAIVFIAVIAIFHAMLPWLAPNFVATASGAPDNAGGLDYRLGVYRDSRAAFFGAHGLVPIRRRAQFPMTLAAGFRCYGGC